MRRRQLRELSHVFVVEDQPDGGKRSVTSCSLDGFRRISSRLTLAVLVALVLRVSVQAQEAGTSQQAAGPSFYKGREIAQTMHYFGAPWLIRESRQREEDCETMIEQLKLKRGMQVCDVGCGNGFYTLKLAQRVGPTGRVYAVDIQPEMLRLMQARATEVDLSNIQSILGTPTDPKLPANTMDVVLLVDVYHEFSDPEPMLQSIRAALKPDGVAVLLEFREEDPEVPIKPLHKMSKAQILKEWKPNGFELVREFDELPWQHMMFFQRSER